MQSKIKRALVIAFSLALISAIAVGIYGYAEAKFDEEWGKRYDAIRNEACSKITGECLVRFSAYDEDFFGLPKSNLNEVAYIGKIRFIMKRDSWRDHDYQSHVFTNPTWIDIAKAANEMIKVTGDAHHVYLEDFEEIGEEGDIVIAEFVMGS